MRPVQVTSRRTASGGPTTESAIAQATRSSPGCVAVLDVLLISLYMQHVLGLVWFSQISVHGSYVADILGPAVLAAVATSVTGSSRAPAVLTDGFQEAFLTGAGFAVLGLAATLLLIRTSDSRAARGAEPGPGHRPPGSRQVASVV